MAKKKVLCEVRVTVTFDLLRLTSSRVGQTDNPRTFCGGEM